MAYPSIDIPNLFSYHTPKNDQAERYIALRSGAKDYADLIAKLTPPSAEQTLALRALHLASMHANSAIACNE